MTREIAGENRVLGLSWKDLVLIGLVVLAIVVCFADVLFLPYTFYYQDIQFLHYPGKIYFSRSLAEGEYSFWSPYIFAGYPLQAEPEVGPLYPFNLLFNLPVPPYYAQTLFVVLHYVFAGTFTYLLARSFEIGREGAFAAAVVYACSGYLMAQLTNFSILTATVWLPLILLCFSLALRFRSYRYAVGGGIVVALFILTAHPQFILLTFTVLGLYYVYRLVLILWGRGAGDKVRLISIHTALLAVMVGVGSALSAPQLLPAYQLKSLSVLSESLGFDFVTSYSLSPYRMVSFLFPNFLGNQAIGYRGPAFFEEHHDYIGLLPLMILPFAWAKRRNSTVLFFMILLVLSTVLSWGRLVPVYHLIAELPLYNLFRVPARWLYPMTLSLAMLVGFGFDRLLGAPHSPGVRRYVRWCALAAIALTVTLPWVFWLRPYIMDVTDWFIENVHPSFTIFTLRSVVKAWVRFPDPPPTNFLLQAVPFMINPLIAFLVMLDLGAALLFSFTTGKLGRRWFSVAAGVLICLDLLLVGGSAINPVVHASYFDERESTRFLQANVGLHRIYPMDQDADPNLFLGHYFPLIYRIPSFGGSSSLTVRWYREYRDAAAENPRLYDLAGVKYVLGGEDMPQGFSGPLQEVFSASGLHIYENPNVMPRAFIVHRAFLEESTTEPGASRLRDPTFPFGEAVLLHDPAALALLDGSDVASLGSDRAEITHYSYNRATIECATEAAGFLFFSDSYYPGWQAEVDGVIQPVYRANHMFRAVYLPPGEHVVTFRFVQPVFWWGVGLAGLTVLILLVIWFAGFRRAGRRVCPTEPIAAGVL